MSTNSSVCSNVTNIKFKERVYGKDCVVMKIRGTWSLKKGPALQKRVPHLLFE